MFDANSYSIPNPCKDSSVNTTCFFYQARESSLVPVGFLIAQFLQKLWFIKPLVLWGTYGGLSLKSFPGGKRMCRDAWKDAEFTCLHFSCFPCYVCRWTPNWFSKHNKGFLNYVFWRNLAVRNPAGTRLDNLAW